MNDFLLAERIFGPPDAKPENSPCYLDRKGNVIAFSLLVPPVPKAGSAELIGGIRWFGVHPDHRRRGFGKALMKESRARLKRLGATTADFLSTPPYYIQPGVDVRATGVIVWLIAQGFEHYRTNFNMTVDLRRIKIPPAKEIFGGEREAYRVRRAREEDREAFRAYCLRDWTPGWTAEASQGLAHDPVSLFLAVKESGRGKDRKDRKDRTEEIVGFASYETNQGLGSFGPTGVNPDHQGHGLGRRLLWATLADLKKLGRPTSQIGWVGPVDFYHRAVGADLGPVFWGMRGKL